MTKLSRMDKFQALRDELDQDTTEANQVKPSLTPTRLSRMAHAQELTRQNATKPLPAEEGKSPVLDNLIDEVKQYNLTQGTSLSDDTQINILKQLDGSQSLHRNAHYVAMEEPEDQLGDTRKIDMDDTLPTLLKTENWLTDRQPEQKEDPVVLSNDDLKLEPTPEPIKQEETIEQTIEPVVEKPVKIKAKPKKLKPKRQVVSEAKPKPKKDKTNTILNVILVILIITLIGAIAFTYMTFKSLGVF